MTLCIYLNHTLEFLCANVANICCKSDIKQLWVSIFTNENLLLHGGSSYPSKIIFFFCQLS